MSTWQAEPSRNVMLIDLELWELSERDGTSSDRKSRSAVKTMKAHRRSMVKESLERCLGGASESKSSVSRRLSYIPMTVSFRSLLKSRRESFMSCFLSFHILFSND